MNQKITPPKLARQLLCNFLREDLMEEVEGDLEERFYASLNRKSILRAKLTYWYEVIHYLRPFAIRKKKSSTLNSFCMFKNHFRIGWRNLLKQKGFSAIKILGFAIGIASCMLIALFIRDEISYDQFIPNKERIYRVQGVFHQDGKDLKDVWFPAPFAQAILNDYPEVESAARLNPSLLFGAGSNEVRRAEEVESFHETGFTFADQSFLTMLQIPMVYGNREHALDKPNTIVISRRKAEKYFPGENPLGKILILNNDNQRQYSVAGVMENFPANSHLQYDFLLTLTGFEPYKGEQTNWMANNYPTYVMVKPGTDQHELEKKMMGIVHKYVVPLWKANNRSNIDEMLKNIRLELLPVADIHLYATTGEDGLSHGDIKLVWLFGGIAVFILIIACINFINLSTAKSANRAKEVGIRKVMGSYRDHLVKQFLIESMLYSFISFFIGFMLAGLLLPYFNILSAKSIVFPWTEWWLMPVMLGASLIVGLVAGLYPSFYLSKFMPIEVLKGKLASGSKNSSLRSTLVIFQFTASIVLIICTIVIYQQMNFILNKNVGFNKDQVVIIHGTNALGNQTVSFREELKNLSSVKSASISSYLPIRGMMRNGNTFSEQGKNLDNDGVNSQRWEVDEGYVPTLGLKLLEGRNFYPLTAIDSATAIVNQQLVKSLGLKNPIGHQITNGWETLTIVGIVEDFHFETMKEKIGGLVMVRSVESGNVSVKIESGDIKATLDEITSVWKKFSPNQTIRYTFMDDSFAKMYEDVQRLGQIFITFAILAILVACLGLFALSAFMVEQRSKEISIRVVLGASMTTIFNMLTGSFVKLVIISILIASPLAWWGMREWLNEYQYKITIGGEIFIYAGFTALIIALSTVSYQSLRAAFANPTKNLRSE